MNKTGNTYKRSPASFELSENLVHIWKGAIDDPPLNIDKLHVDLLSQEEKARADRLKSEKDRTRFILSRSLLRKSLSHYLDAAPSEIRFIYNKYGKPDIDPRRHKENIKFNLSHSGNLVLYAITQDREIGIDVEYIRKVDKADKIVKRFFSKEEGEFYRSQPINNKNWAFFTLWTRKEAYSKARGMGIGLPAKEFDLQLVPSGADNSTVIRTGSKASKWSLINIDVDSNYLAALATEGNNIEISHWEFDNIFYEKKRT